jgi:Tfp pilus assembly PilM family ATPase
MATRSAMAIDLGRRRLRAVQGGVARRGSLRIRRTLVEDTPADLNFDDPSALGAWAGEVLRRAGFPRGHATIAIGREHVGLKRITLPTTDPAELPDMTRLALQRELPFDAESAIIDFLPVERHETSTTVLAVAVPQRLIEHTAQWAKTAGLKVERIALRTTGCAGLLMSMENVASRPSSVVVEDVGGIDDSRLTIDDLAADTLTATQSSIVNRQSSIPGATLAIDVVGEGVEFCVVAGGSIRFSRAAEVPAPQDQLAMAEAVVTEARRTWMSYRAADDSGAMVSRGAAAGAIAAAHIMGDRRVAEYAAGPLGQMLKIPVQVLREHPRIDAGRPGEHEMDRLWPLAGMLLERELGLERIDFLHPRRAPDLGARTRQRRLLAAATLLLVGGVAFTFMRNDLRNLQSRVESLQAQRDQHSNEFKRDWRNQLKLEHLQQWSAVHVDWLEHAKFLAQVAPPPEEIVLDSWSGTLDFRGVAFDARKFEAGKSAWAAPHQTTIVIEGEARTRPTADAFREALTQNTIYTTTTTGADTSGGKRMPYGFTYRLRTRAASPPQEAEGQQTAAASATTSGDSDATRQVASEAATSSGAPTEHTAADGSQSSSAQPAEQ